MKAFKGFNKDLQCRGFQYQLGETYEEERADLCETGFHACERPLDVFSYYSPGNGSRYCEVELIEPSNQAGGGDSKRVAKKIKIGAEIGVPGLVKAQIEYVKAHTTTEYTDPEKATAGEYGAATAGNRGAATAGYAGAATSKGSSAVGAQGIACARGNDVKVKGGLGAVLVLVEESQYSYDIDSWKAVVVDGETIKPDTWYGLKNGEVIEIKETENKEDK